MSRIQRSYLVAHMAIAACTAVMILAACTRQEARTAANAALTVGQLICLETQPSYDVEAAQIACGIISNPITRDIIGRLLSQRASAQRMGFVWTDPDAGVDVDAAR